jgi:hypothetical protein
VPERLWLEVTAMAVREARLRPEWADLYPGIRPDVWQVAAELVPHVLRYRLRGEQRWEFTRRILVDEHFEFRGGRPRDSTWTGVLSRVEDA